MGRLVDLTVGYLPKLVWKDARSGRQFLFDSPAPLPYGFFHEQAPWPARRRCLRSFLSFQNVAKMETLIASTL